MIMFCKRCQRLGSKYRKSHCKIKRIDSHPVRAVKRGIRYMQFFIEAFPLLIFRGEFDSFALTIPQSFEAILTEHIGEGALGNSQSKTVNYLRKGIAGKPH